MSDGILVYMMGCPSLTIHYTTREDFAVRHLADLLTDFTIIKNNPSFYSSTELFHF